MFFFILGKVIWNEFTKEVKKGMLLLFIISLIVLLCILLIFFPFKIVLNIYFDIFKREKFILRINALGKRMKKEWRVSIADIPGGLYGLWILNEKNRRFLLYKSYDKEKKKRKVDYALMKQALLKIRINEIDVNGKIGVKRDAAATAICTGTIQAVLFSLSTALLPPKESTTKKINIIPAFNNACFNFDAKCIITVRLEHIISAGWNNLLLKRKKAV